MDPVGAIIDAFRTHDLVAMSDAHGNVQTREFLRQLIRDARFAGVANDIVVEFGNARYQAVADRYVRGEAVPAGELRAIWQNTTVPNEIPVDPEFFDIVRAVNARLPPEHQFRVLLGDPPIDWSTVRSRADHFVWLGMRDSYPASLVQVEVLAKRRKALVVYGHLHFQRRNMLTNFDMTDWRAQTIVSLLERANPTRVFIIWRLDDELAAIQGSVGSWPVPSLALVRGTQIGAADIAEITPPNPRMVLGAGAPTLIERKDWQPLTIEQQLDAVLYLGPRSAMTDAPLLPVSCKEPGYLEERLRRISVAGLPPAEAERAKQLCEATNAHGRGGLVHQRR